MGKVEAPIQNSNKKEFTAIQQKHVRVRILVHETSQREREREREA